MPKTEARFLGVNLAVIRDFYRLTRDALAHQAAVTTQFLGAVERGAKQPGALLAEAFAEVLQVQPRFFYDPLPDLFEDEQCAFRRRQATSITLRRRLIAHGSLFASLLNYLESKVKFPDPSVPTLSASNTAEIERAAESCRMRWGLGLDTPIVNVIRVLEHAGVIVTQVSAGDTKIDAFSRPGRRRDVVVLNVDKKSGSRTRFDCAHELGHLVLHRDQVIGTPETEAAADYFASAFLLPRAGISREFPRSPFMDWAAVRKLKVRWRVSMQAMVRRAYDLGLISAVAYRRAYKYMSWQGWRRQEPGEFSQEEPEIVVRALDVLEGDGITAASISDELGWTTETFERVSSVPVKRNPTRSGIVVSLRG